MRSDPLQLEDPQHPKNFSWPELPTTGKVESFLQGLYVLTRPSSLEEVRGATVRAGSVGFGVLQSVAVSVFGEGTRRCLELNSSTAPICNPNAVSQSQTCFQKAAFGIPRQAQLPQLSTPEGSGAVQHGADHAAAGQAQRHQGSRFWRL